MYVDMCKQFDHDNMFDLKEVHKRMKDFWATDIKVVETEKLLNHPD
jgi:hypothetical protein